MTVRDQVTSKQVDLKSDKLPMHKRIAMGEALDGKSLGTKETKMKPSNKQKNK
jgi:hypothetical protein